MNQNDLIYLGSYHLVIFDALQVLSVDVLLRNARQSRRIIDLTALKQLVVEHEKVLVGLSLSRPCVFGLSQLRRQEPKLSKERTSSLSSLTCSEITPSSSINASLSRCA